MNLNRSGGAPKATNKLFAFMVNILVSCALFKSKRVLFSSLFLSQSSSFLTNLIIHADPHHNSDLKSQLQTALIRQSSTGGK